MKKILLLSILMLSAGVRLVFGQSSPENIDVGIFPIGTFNSTPNTNEIFEVAIKTDMTFPSVPAAAELNFYVGALTSQYNGSEVFGIVEDQLNGGDMIFQSTFPDLDASHTYVSFVYNGTGINLSTYSIGVWTHVFTVTMSGATTLTPDELTIADINSSLYTDYTVRTALNVLDYNEFYPVSTMPALPLDLISFNAEKYQDRSTLLEWSTVNEINTSNFIIQRSFDKIHWQDIGSKKAAGFSLSIENYDFIDQDVYNGLDSRLSVFYRLIMLDLDGKYEVSPIRSVVFGSDDNLKRELLVYPNPATNGIQVEWSFEDYEQPTTLEIYDISGKLILTQPVAENSNQQYVDFTNTSIQSGLFLLRVMSGDIPIEYKQVVVDQR